MEIRPIRQALLDIITDDYNKGRLPGTLSECYQFYMLHAAKLFENHETLPPPIIRVYQNSYDRLVMYARDRELEKLTVASLRHKIDEVFAEPVESAQYTSEQRNIDTCLRTGKILKVLNKQRLDLNSLFNMKSGFHTACDAENRRNN